MELSIKSIRSLFPSMLYVQVKYGIITSPVTEIKDFEQVCSTVLLCGLVC